MGLPGAITIRSADDEVLPLYAADGDDDHHDDLGRRENALRFSLAGVQIKFSAVNENTGGLNQLKASADRGSSNFLRASMRVYRKTNTR